MNKDRIQGSLEQAKGKVKEVACKVAGDAKLETEGKTQQVAGKIQNAVGGSARPPQLATSLFALSGHFDPPINVVKRTSR